MSTGLANHSGWYTSLMNPVASSFASSFLMASRLSGENRHNRCFFGVALGSTSRHARSTPWAPLAYRWFPREYVSVGPQEVDELEFLFVAQTYSNNGGFGVVSLL